MKVLVIVAVIVAIVVCQDMDMHDNIFHDMIHGEVQAIITNDPSISVDDCTQECDDLLNFLVDSSEQLGDTLCEHACRCEITLTDCEHEMPGANATTTVPPA